MVSHGVKSVAYGFFGFRWILLAQICLASVLYDPETYNFGENWHDYVRELYCSSQKSGDLDMALSVSLANLLNFLSPRSERTGPKQKDSKVLENLSFFDLGCGSGIHSAAAAYAGASHVISFDRQEASLQVTRVLQRIAQRNGWTDEARWDAYLGDLLKRSDLPELRADVVYSWGVLHHTGDMWTAVENACELVKPASEGGGMLLIALYARETVRDPDYWIRIKQKYLSLDDFDREQMEMDYAWWLLKDEVLKKQKNPFIMAKEAMLQRGMNFWTDVKDWLGGYPIEFSEASEVIRFVKQRCGLVPVRVQPSTVTEFLFVTDPQRFGEEDWPKRSKLVLDWQEEIQKVEKESLLLKGPFLSLGFRSRTNCHAAELPLDLSEAEQYLDLSTLRYDVYEDGQPYGFGIESDINGTDRGRTLSTLRSLFEEEEQQKSHPTREWQARFGADGLTCQHPGRYFREVFWVDLEDFPSRVPVVIFSSSDGSDPNHNGRVYSLFIEHGTGQAPSAPHGPIGAELSFLRF